MIIDLARQETEPICCADFVVVGAGIAGLILAARLRRKGARVVVLESGGREQRPETDSLNRAVQLGTPYQGASDGRSRCLGGTSTRWGGALIPFLEHDLAARPYLGLPSFPIGLDAIRGYLADVEAIFGVDASSYEEDVVRQIQATGQVPIGDPDFIVRFAKWPRFKHRNVAVLFQQLLERDPELEVWINATVTNFKIDTASGRIISVLARHQGDRKLSAVGRHYIICAGAIESTRLLLLLDREYDQKSSETAVLWVISSTIMSHYRWQILKRRELLHSTGLQLLVLSGRQCAACDLNFRQVLKRGRYRQRFRAHQLQATKEDRI